MRNRPGRRIGAVIGACVVLALSPVGAAAQGTEEPSPTLGTTEPEVPVARTEETSDTEERLRTIVFGLFGIGSALVIANLVFWAVTRPSRRAHADEEVASVEDVAAAEPAVAAGPQPTAVTEPPSETVAPVPLSVLVAPPVTPASSDQDALASARSLFERLGAVPDLDLATRPATPLSADDEVR